MGTFYINGFQNTLKAKFIDNSDILEVTEDLEYYDYRSKNLIVIPDTFRSNGASIPQCLWSITGYPLQQGVRPAAILHDLLYRKKMFPRVLCDQMFYDAMRYEEVSYLKAQAFYIAVRGFGKSHYDKSRDDNDLGARYA